MKIIENIIVLSKISISTSILRLSLFQNIYSSVEKEIGATYHRWWTARQYHHHHQVKYTSLLWNTLLLSVQETKTSFSITVQLLAVIAVLLSPFIFFPPHWLCTGTCAVNFNLSSLHHLFFIFKFSFKSQFSALQQEHYILSSYYYLTSYLPSAYELLLLARHYTSLSHKNTPLFFRY